MNSLNHVLKQYHKDQISLSNLKIKLISLSERIKQMKDEKANLEVRFESLLNKISSVKNNYQSVTKEVLKNVGLPNTHLQTKIAKITNLVLEKHSELEYVMVFLLGFF